MAILWMNRQRKFFCARLLCPSLCLWFLKRSYHRVFPLVRRARAFGPLFARLVALAAEQLSRDGDRTRTGAVGAALSTPTQTQTPTPRATRARGSQCASMAHSRRLRVLAFAFTPLSSALPLRRNSLLSAGLRSTLWLHCDNCDSAEDFQFCLSVKFPQ